MNFHKGCGSVFLDTLKIKKMISDASNVIIMAHKNLDLDALGSSLGIYYLCKSLGKNAFLLIEEDKSEMGVSRSLRELQKRKININIGNLEKLKPTIDKQSLLIVLDVNISDLTQNKEVLKMIKNIIVIDHHIKDKEAIKNVNYKYIEEMKSSTSEIVVDLLQTLNIYIPPYIATIMLAGIVIDTNRFSIKTNHETYEAASILHQHAIDPIELQYLLKEDLNRYIRRQKIISEVEIIEGKFAVGIGEDDHAYYKEDIAKISDTLLLFNGIEASFTIGKIEDEVVGISARSIGNVDVQKIMEKLNGGGHVTDAATQMKNISVKEAKQCLLKMVEKIK